MDFYNTSTTENSLVHEIWALCDANITSYPLADVTRRVNAALEELVGKIIAADGQFQYDDTNYTDLPISTGTLVSGQSTYSFASEYLDILEIDILDLQGRYLKITPFDSHELGMSFDEWVNSSSGTVPNGFPRYYDKIGDTIRLDRAPTAAYCTLASGLKVYFKRTVSLFVVATEDGTTGTDPGLPSPYHVLLAYKAALPYCVSYKKDRVGGLMKMIGSDNRRDPYYGGMTRDLVKFYGLRERDRKKVMTMKKSLYV